MNVSLAGKGEAHCIQLGSCVSAYVPFSGSKQCVKYMAVERVANSYFGPVLILEVNSGRYQCQVDNSSSHPP